MSATKASQASKKFANTPLSHGVGRRKSSVARVWLRKGKGQVVVNKQAADEYFTTHTARESYKKPFGVVPAAADYDILVNVCGGGINSQADATKLAISRALVTLDEEVRSALREHGLLTVDSRLKERKKYGQRGARRKFQFVKR